MTEVKQPNYEIIARDFEGVDIDFIKKDKEIWISTTAIAKGLGLSRDNINQSYHRNKHLLESHTTNIKIISEKGPRNTRVFDRTGFIYLCIRSNSPNAIPFQEWVLNVIDEIMEKGYYIEKSLMIGSTDWALQTVEIMRSVLLNQKEQELKQKEQERRIKLLEEKDRYIFVTPRTKRKLQDEVHRISNEYFDSKHYRVWNPLKAYLQVNRYEEFKEEDAQKILEGFAREYPPKFIQNIEKKNQTNGEKRGLKVLWDIEKEGKNLHREEDNEV